MVFTETIKAACTAPEQGQGQDRESGGVCIQSSPGDSLACGSGNDCEGPNCNAKGAAGCAPDRARPPHCPLHLSPALGLESHYPGCGGCPPTEVLEFGLSVNCDSPPPLTRAGCGMPLVPINFCKNHSMNMHKTPLGAYGVGKKNQNTQELSVQQKSVTLLQVQP